MSAPTVIPPATISAVTTEATFLNVVRVSQNHTRYTGETDTAAYSPSVIGQ